jgi:fused signal recognition particle receptor
MALGFIKKIFSFGKKEIEEVPAEKPLSELDQLPTPEQLYEDTTAQEALNVPAETIPAEAEPVVAEQDTAFEETAAEPELLQDIEPVIVEQAEIESQPIDEVIEASDEIESPTSEAAIGPVPIPAPEAPASKVVEESEPVVAPKPSKVTVSKTVEEKQAEPAIAEPERRLSWFERLRKGLFRSSQQLGDSIGSIFTRRKLDEDTLQDLEDVLIQADLGMETAIRITGALSATRYGKDISTEEVRAIMAAEIEKVLGPVAKPLELDLSHKPHVILVVGVNGTGKTTTIGKLAAKLTAGGLNVMLAAGDTFRAAAIEQLHIWGKRTGAPVVSSKLGADAAGLAFDAWKQAKEAGSDVLIIDTAGRLQNRAELMDELAKIVRVLGKNDPEAPHTVLQTLDATTGQNALNQVEIFKNIAGVNGLVMTKLDGTARGGILVAISAKHKLPVYFIGVGEQVEDLEPFAASDFAKAIAGVA